MAISGPQPDRSRNEVPQCDTGKGLVAADGLWGTLFGVASLAAFSNEEAGAGVALGAVTALFIASAARGNRAANECRDSFNEYNVAIRDADQRRLIADTQPAVRVRPKKKPKPVEPPPEPVPQQVEPEPAPVVEEPQPEPAPEYSTPRPAPVKPAPPVAKPAPKPKPKPAPTDDDWSSFWKEVP